MPEALGAGFEAGADDVVFGVETGAGAVVLPGVEGETGVAAEVAAGAGDVVAVSTGVEPEVEPEVAPEVWSITGADAENPLDISAAKPT